MSSSSTRLTKLTRRLAGQWLAWSRVTDLLHSRTAPKVFRYKEPFANKEIADNSKGDSSGNEGESDLFHAPCHAEYDTGWICKRPKKDSVHRFRRGMPKQQEIKQMLNNEKTQEILSWIRTACHWLYGTLIEPSALAIAAKQSRFLLSLLIAMVLLAPAVQAQSAPSINFAGSSISAGSFSTSQTLTITTSSGTIYYTDDGSTPTNSSTPYTGPITISGPTQINAVSYLSPNYSTVTTAYVDVDGGLVPVLQGSLILRLEAGLGVETTSGTEVSSWKDLSGNGSDATGASGTRPTLVTSSSSTQPYINFSGSSQYLSLPSGFANFPSPTQIAITGNPPTAAATETLKITISSIEHDASYSATTSDTNQSIASGLAAAINALSVSGLSATVIDNTISVIAPSGSTFASTMSGGISASKVTTITVSGAPPTGSSSQSISVAGSYAYYSSTVSSTNEEIANGLFSIINGRSLSGVSGEVDGATITFFAPVGTAYTESGSDGISLTQGPTGGLTCFLVMKPTSLTAGSNFLDLGNVSTGNNVQLGVSNLGSYGEVRVYSGTDPGYTAESGTTLSSNRYQVLSAVVKPGSSHATGTVYLNNASGTSVSTMNNIADTTRSDNSIGLTSSTGETLSGSVAELLVYANALPEQQCEAINRWLMEKYQILTQTPVTPVISVPSGTLSGPTQVIVSTTPDSDTYVTTDGSTPDPSNSAQLYAGGPITINYSQTVQAISVKNGISSSVSSATYTLDSTLCPAPSECDTSAPNIELQLPTPAIP